MQIDKFAKRQGNDESFRFIIVVLITLISQLEHAFVNLSMPPIRRMDFFNRCFQRNERIRNALREIDFNVNIISISSSSLTLTREI